MQFGDKFKFALQWLIINEIRNYANKNNLTVWPTLVWLDKLYAEIRWFKLILKYSDRIAVSIPLFIESNVTYG